MRKLTREDGYVEIKTPLLFNKQLWMKSGHWDKYKENMFLVQDSDSGELDYGLKPMNCPSHHVLLRLRQAQLPRAAAAPAHARTCCTATRRPARWAG